MSLVEELFVRSWPDRPLAVAYRDLARAVRERNEEDIESLLDAITREAERPVTSADRAVREGVAPDRRVPADLEALARRALALFPDSARVAHALGRAYATLGLFPEALPLLETSAGGPEGSGPRDQGLLLTCAVRAGDTQAAARQIGRLRALLLSRRFGKPPWDLSEALGYVRRALPSMRELQRRELDGSVAVPALRLLIDLARSLLVRSPDEHQKAALYNNIALYLLLLHYYQPEAQHPKRAIGFARKAVHLDPRHGRYNIACALALLGRRKQALDALGNLSTEELKQADPRTDRDWQAYWDDPEFKEILVRAEGKDGPASRQAPGDPSPPGQRRRASARPSSRRR
jgi:tetratricopeptide (TPR) repeat protein